MSTSIQIRAMGDLATMFRALALTGDGATTGDIGGHVYTELEEERLNPQLPCILLTVMNQTPKEEKSSFNYDHVIYPIRIQIVDVTRPINLFQACLPTYTLWYETIEYLVRARCIPPVLTNTPEAYDLRITSAVQVNKEIRKGQTIALEFSVLVKTAKTRVKTSG